MDWLVVFRDEFANWLPLLFGVLLILMVYILWRTLQVMPKVTAAKTISPKSTVSWDDVAGLDEAKGELAEVIDFLRDPVRFGRAHDARAGEAPAPVDDDADPEAFAFAGGDALDSTALDRDRFLEAMDDPNVGIRCAELHRRIQGALAQVTHREAEGSRADGRQRARAFSLFPMARLFRHAGLTRSARLPGATPKHPRTLDRRSRRRASISEASPS